MLLDKKKGNEAACTSYICFWEQILVLESSFVHLMNNREFFF